MLDFDQNEITVLLQRWRDGDHPARDAVFEQIYEKLRVAARAPCRSTGLGEPESVVNDLFVNLCDADGRVFHSRRDFAAYCAKSLRNLLLDRQRRVQVRLRHLESSAGETVEGYSDLRTERFDVDAALNELAREHEKEADALTFRIAFEMTIEDIAALNECSVATVGRQLKFAKFFLETRLHEFRSQPLEADG